MNWKLRPPASPKTSSRGGYWVKGGVIGACFGLFIWVYDYDFLLNAGGPSTPISDYIRALFNIVPWKRGAAFPPLYILITLFGTFGIVTGYLYDKYKNRKQLST